MFGLVRAPEGPAPFVPLRWGGRRFLALSDKLV